MASWDVDPKGSGLPQAPSGGLGNSIQSYNQANAWKGDVGNYQAPGYQPINWGNYLNTFQGFFNQQNQKTPEEIAALQQITKLSHAFGGGAEGYQQAMDYYGKIAGGNRAAAMQAAAPQAAQAAEVYGGAQRGLEAQAGLSAGARAAGAADLARQKAGAISDVVLNQRPAAAAALGQLGLQGGQLSEQAAADAGKLAQNRALTGMQLTAQLAAQAGAAELQGRLGFAGLSLDAAKSADAARMQLYFGNRAADQAAQDAQERQREFDEQLGQTKREFDWQTNTYFPWAQGEASANRKSQQQAGKEGLFGNILGTGAGLIK